MLVFFSSGLRPRYARDVLDALCYPDGHVLHFRYRKDLVEFDSKEKKRILAPDFLARENHKEGLIVFIDGLELSQGIKPEDQRFDFSFYPIRLVKVLTSIEQGDWYYVALKLTAFPAYKNGKTFVSFDEYIKQMPQRPRRRNHISGEGFFVSRADKNLELQIEACTNDKTQNVWEANVKDLRGTQRFGKNTLFYRVLDISAVKEKSDDGTADINLPNLRYELEEVKPYYDINLDQSIYNVRADSEFRLRMINYLGHVLEKTAKIELKADASVFTGMVDYVVIVDSAYNEESIFLRSKRATESSLTTLELEPTNGPDDMLAAHPQFLVKVHPAYGDYIRAAILLGFGQLFLSLDKTFLKDYGFNESGWIVFTKIFGFLCTVAGIWFAFRKLKI